VKVNGRTPVWVHRDQANKTKADAGMLSGYIDKILYKIRRKIQPDTVVVKGIRVSASLDDVPSKIRRQLYKNNYENGELTLVREALREHDRVLEVGAGTGFISIACAKIVGPGNILSYEPNPAMRRVVEKNHQLNGLSANLRNRVLAVDKGEVRFFFSENVLSSSLIDRDHGGETLIAADSIRDVVREYQPTAIVIDAEGAEVDLLRNCDLTGISKIVIEMHPHIVGQDEIEKLSAFLIGQGLMLEEQLGKRYLFLRPGHENMRRSS
jgi:FkbM family methyltransferase